MQDRTELDVGGFVIYMDVFIIRVTQNKKVQLESFTQHKAGNVKEIRRLYIQETLEKMINTKQQSVEQIVYNLIETERNINDTDRRHL